MISPSSFAVFALKFLQKSMMFTPCGPSAVPTGGAGVALPAAIWSFTSACIFFAIPAYIANERFATKSRRARRLSFKCFVSFVSSWLDLFYLQEIQFHGRRAAEDR